LNLLRIEAIFNECFRTSGHYWGMVFSLFRRMTAPRFDRRLEPRGTRVDGHISVNGRDYPLKDWSRRGFSAVGFGAEHYPGDKIRLGVSLDLPDGEDGATVTFECAAVVVWVDRERRELAGVFTELDLRIQERIMRALFASQAAERQIGAPLHA